MGTNLPLQSQYALAQCTAPSNPPPGHHTRPPNISFRTSIMLVTVKHGARRCPIGTKPLAVKGDEKPLVFAPPLRHVSFLHWLICTWIPCGNSYPALLKSSRSFFTMQLDCVIGRRSFESQCLNALWIAWARVVLAPILSIGLPYKWQSSTRLEAKEHD